MPTPDWAEKTNVEASAALQDAVRKVMPKVKAAWVACVSKSANGTAVCPSYRNVGSLAAALDVRATIASITCIRDEVSPAPGTDVFFSIYGSIVLSGSMVLSAHNKGRKGLEGNAAAIHSILSNGTAAGAGVVGSFWKNKKPFLINYLAEGPNVPQQPAIYTHLGNRGRHLDRRNMLAKGMVIHTDRDAAKGQTILKSFAQKMGFTINPWKAQLRAGMGHLDAPDQNNIIEQAAATIGIFVRRAS